MAPKKSRYNAALSREEQARQRLLENSGGEFDFSDEEVQPFVAENVQRFPEIDLTEQVQKFPEIDLTKPSVIAPEMDLSKAIQRKQNQASIARLAKAVQNTQNIAAKENAPLEDPILQRMVDRASKIAEDYASGNEKAIENQRRIFENAEANRQAAENVRKTGRLTNELDSYLVKMEETGAEKIFSPPKGVDDTPLNRELFNYAGFYTRPSVEVESVPSIVPESQSRGFQVPEQAPEQIPAVPPALPQAVDTALVPAAPAPSPTPSSAAPVKPVSPEQDRLSQLASILKLTGAPAEGQTPDARQQAIIEALGKAQQGLYAGLTRSQLPASFFTPSVQPARAQEDQLNRLYKAAQIQQMLTPRGAELASDAAKQFLTKNAPELLEGVDLGALTQKDADRLMNLHAGGQKAKAQKELQDIRLKDANARAKERLDFAREQMDQRDYEFVTKQIAGGTKQAQAAVRALPALEQLFNEQLELDVKGGADFLSRAGAGALNDAEQRKFDMLYERIIAEDRKRLFGATLTGNELDTFNRISAQGPNVPMADKLEALRALMKGMQQELKAAFVPVEDKPAFLQFEARSGISHRNPMFTAFDETLRKRAEEMPRTGAGGLKEGLSNIAGQAGSFLDELFGPSPTAPAPAPSPTAAPPLPTGQAVIEPERPQPKTEARKKPLRRVEYQGKQGWYDTERGVFISDEEMKAIQSGTPMTVSPGR